MDIKHWNLVIYTKFSHPTCGKNQNRVNTFIENVESFHFLEQDLRPHLLPVRAMIVIDLKQDKTFQQIHCFARKQKGKKFLELSKGIKAMAYLCRGLYRWSDEEYRQVIVLVNPMLEEVNVLKVPGEHRLVVPLYFITRRARKAAYKIQMSPAPASIESLVPLVKIRTTKNMCKIAV